MLSKLAIWTFFNDISVRIKRCKVCGWWMDKQNRVFSKIALSSLWPISLYQGIGEMKMFAPACLLERYQDRFSAYYSTWSRSKKKTTVQANFSPELVSCLLPWNSPFIFFCWSMWMLPFIECLSFIQNTPPNLFWSNNSFLFLQNIQKKPESEKKIVCCLRLHCFCEFGIWWSP